MTAAVAMVVAVGSILAFLAAGLKEKISENKRLEKQQNILYAMGVNENDDTSANFVSTDKVGAEWTNYIKKQIVIQDNETCRALTLTKPFLTAARLFLNYFASFIIFSFFSSRFTFC